MGTAVTFDVVTRQTRAAGAAAAWARQYPEMSRPLSAWMVTAAHQTHGDVYAALVALGPHPDPDAVSRVIGNDSWTRVPSCDHCGRDAPAVVVVGEAPDYESSTAAVCEECLVAALAAVRNAAAPPLHPPPAVAPGDEEP